MDQNHVRPLLTASVSRALGWSVVYFLLIVGTFTFPNFPLAGLDASWRMALGYFYENGMQFGRDVVFTYGPLGFVMAKTFSGLQFWSLILGQLILAIISATVIIRQGWRLPVRGRLVYFAFMFIFGISYEDALHMLVIAILGFELLRLVDEPRLWRIVAIAAVLGGYAQIKFTDLLLGGVIVAVVAGYGLWQKRPKEVAGLSLAFVGTFLGIWVLCGQRVGNLPSFFRGSLEISAGYQWAMGFPSPPSPLWKGLLVLFLLVVYVAVHLRIHPNKPRAVANSIVLGAFIYLNWKHGFVRADGHMVGFFCCALLPLTAYPALLDDADRFRFAHRWVFLLAVLLCGWGLESALGNSVRASIGTLEAKIWYNLTRVVYWKETRQIYRDKLTGARTASDLSATRKIVGQASLDVIGCEQSVALFNRFNYRPRPVIQGYSTFTPYLAQLNGDFFAAENAPEYLLVRLDTIDGRLMTLDDAQVLHLLPYRYTYLFTENGFNLWKRNAGAFDRTSLAPKLIRTESATVNRPLKIADLAGKPLWAKIDLQPSLLGRIRNFFYKPPQVMLGIQDTSGNTTAKGYWDYLMPLPQGRNGFILNPIISDTVDYMHYASNTPQRWVSTITLKIAPDDVKYFASNARVELSALPAPASSATAFFPTALEQLFTMFRTIPISFTSHTGFSDSVIDNKTVAIMHAPSQMVFDLPDGAQTLRGAYGYMPEAYTGNAKTNGAVFTIYWSNGASKVELHRRFLNPLSVAEDHGLHNFSVPLKGLAAGRLYLEVDPGPFSDISWDWTGWTEISISK